MQPGSHQSHQKTQPQIRLPPSSPSISSSLSPRTSHRSSTSTSSAPSTLLEGIRDLHHRPRFIFFSTGGAVYGDLEESALPASETINAKPLSPYAVSKLAIEHYLRVYGHLYDLNYTIVRPANVYGPRQNPHGEAGVIAIFTQAMLEGRAITIFGDGNDQRDYIYIADFIDGVLTLADSNLPGPIQHRNRIRHLRKRDPQHPLRIHPRRNTPATRATKSRRHPQNMARRHIR